ncbi:MULTISPECIES: glucosaminidase domain-containing protein [Clostridium]|nr:MULTISPECIES: glucosaminidase domain-containing protein [Clostridium]KEH91271.1 hypothetical protein Z963_09965 [Clostridium botulinum C/D str. It1]
MKKKMYWLKGVCGIMLGLGVFIIKSSLCYADAQAILEVDSNKKWEIKFNKPISRYTVYDGVQIKDDKNNICDLVFYIKDNNTKIVVECIDNFKKNKVYTLTVNNSIKDENGRKLAHSKSIKFKVNNQTESDLELENNHSNCFEKNPIMGKSDLVAKSMGDYVLSHNKNPKTSIDIYSLAKLFLEEGQAEGVRGDIAFCQSIKETGFFKYGGQVLPEQNNYAGIGALNNEPIGKGAWFKEARDGVRAQIQHLKGYASKEELKNPCIDPRYNILRNLGVCGSAYYWEDLNGKWAVPGKNYGEDIIHIYNSIKKLR